MSKELVLFCDADGKWKLYDDAYDITIHCNSKREQDAAYDMLRNATKGSSNVFSSIDVLKKYTPQYPSVAAAALSDYCKAFSDEHSGCFGCPFDVPKNENGMGCARCKLDVPAGWNL